MGVVDLIDLGNSFRIQKGEALCFYDRLHTHCQLGGFLSAMYAHNGTDGAICHFFSNVGRADDQNIRRVCSPARGGLGFVQQSVHSGCDAGGTKPKAILGIVGAQHNN